MSLSDSIFQLIVQTSVNLPADVRRLISQAYENEQEGSLSKRALETICRNIDLAVEQEGAICQDTGLPTFLVKAPVGFDQIKFKKLVEENVAKATEAGLLRPNSVDSVTGKNSGNNLGPGTPLIYFEQHAEDDLIVELSLKGGGSENMSRQYSLPCELPELGAAGRDLAGVRKCLIDAVQNAQGKGCAPGYLGVCIGSDRASGYAYAKKQLFRPADDQNSDPELAALEKRIVEECNSLGIGAMGFGGKMTVLGCKIGKLNRIPASFFVSVAYQCWAFRRLGVVLDAEGGTIKTWLHREDTGARLFAEQAGIKLSGKEIVLQAPISEEQIRKVKVGDVVVINGAMHTGRDALHKYLIKNQSPVDLNGHVIYHCGPVMTRESDGSWKVRAAGPTTSIREEPYQADVIKKFGVRAVIGKGGMGARTLKGLQEGAAVYLTAIGGAAQVYAENLFTVDGVDFLEEFGVPEAMWHLQARDFVTVCTMDSHGKSLHAEIIEQSRKNVLALAD